MKYFVALAVFEAILCGCVCWMLYRILSELRLLRGEAAKKPEILAGIAENLAGIGKKRRAARISDRAGRWLNLRCGKNGGE